MNGNDHINGNEIAIIGMAGRFPQASNLDEYWQNLRSGVECIQHFSKEELQACGIPASTLDNPNYIRAKGMLEDVDRFDAAFFGYSPRDAEIIDPQQRLFLECSWHALEHAGYDPLTYEGQIGVYAGDNVSLYHTYLLFNLAQQPQLRETLDTFQILLANDKDYLTTRVSYKLNLRGPSIDVQTACSTSLVAVHLACQSLLNGESDMALAGGVSIHDYQKGGYLYKEGGIVSPDGHCRSFDADAQGTLSGSGVGIVVLKRLADALTDRDTIHAVIKGTACNNDGASKIGYTAPSVHLQAEVIAEAQAMAGISPQSVSYIEAHGTATPLGDPIEIAALTRAFRIQTEKKNFCAVGSVKTNLGHLGPAAGIAGLLKTVLALKHQELPASLHFTQPNPQIDFANSPFYVNDVLTPWRRGMLPRRAGVSSFGIGGTNVHVVLEEAPLPQPHVCSSRPWHLLPLSAKTDNALQQTTANLAQYLAEETDASLEDVAYTLQVGRSRFERRQILLCQQRTDAVKALKELDATSILRRNSDAIDRPVAFLFPGQGTQYMGMGYELYQTESVFREEIDLCAVLLENHVMLDIRMILYPDEGAQKEAVELLAQTWLTQPALFMIEYALAKLWESWGIRPLAMLGHSIGEYVAACLAGVFSLSDALRLVAIRGRLMQRAAPGAMLAITLKRSEVAQILAASEARGQNQLTIAATNAPEQVVVSGTREEIAGLEEQIRTLGVDCRRMKTSRAFHSALLDPILDDFRGTVCALALQPPQLRFVSNLTGTWITTAQATDPDYWVQHMRQEVRFADGMRALLSEPDLMLVEVGPGKTLSTLAHQQLQPHAAPVILTSLPHATDTTSAYRMMLTSLGRLWLTGVNVAWEQVYYGERRKHVPLPVYPLERQRYWFEPARPAPDTSITTDTSEQKKAAISNWFYAPIWKQTLISAQDSEALTRQKFCWLILLDQGTFGLQLAHHLKQAGQQVVTIRQGERYEVIAPGTYMLQPEQREDYLQVQEAIEADGYKPDKVLHLWNLAASEKRENVSAEALHSQAFFSLLYLAQAFGEQTEVRPLTLYIVSNQLHEVTGEETICAERALLMGPCRVIPLEYPHITCCSIDLMDMGSMYQRSGEIIGQILATCLEEKPAAVQALRGKYRWSRVFEPLALPEPIDETSPLLRKHGVYLITGGLGGIGLTLAAYLARNVQARLVLVGRSSFPERSLWEEWLSSHDGQETVSRSIRKLQELEELGARLLVLSADVTNQEQMQVVLAQATTHFGMVHGVLHTAGIAGGGALQLKEPDAARQVLSPKVAGTRVLEKVCQGQRMDFFLVCSSLSSIRGGFGQVDYCAANAFLDAFAYEHQARTGIPTLSIDWDVWQEVGMAVNTPQPADLKERRRRGLWRAIQPEEGANAFGLALRAQLPQIVVSTTMFHDTIMKPQMVSTTDATHKQTQTVEQRPDQAGSAHPRPDLDTPYVAPRNAQEQDIARIWELLLGIDRVGIHDHFFDLGGHSLLATQVVSRLRALHIELSLRKFLEGATVAHIAAHAAQDPDGQKDQVDLTQVPSMGPSTQRQAEQELLANLDTLSDTEVEVLLRGMVIEE